MMAHRWLAVPAAEGPAGCFGATPARPGSRPHPHPGHTRTVCFHLGQPRASGSKWERWRKGHCQRTGRQGGGTGGICSFDKSCVTRVTSHIMPHDLFLDPLGPKKDPIRVHAFLAILTPNQGSIHRWCGERSRGFAPPGGGGCQCPCQGRPRWSGLRPRRPRRSAAAE